MSAANGRLDDAITDFSRRLVGVDGVVKTVYTAGSGPAIVLMPEMPGISPDVLRLARRRVVDSALPATDQDPIYMLCKGKAVVGVACGFVSVKDWGRADMPRIEQGATPQT